MRVWVLVRIAGAKYVEKNVVGHDVLRQDDFIQYTLYMLNKCYQFLMSVLLNVDVK